MVHTLIHNPITISLSSYHDTNNKPLYGWSVSLAEGISERSFRHEILDYYVRVCSINLRLDKWSLRNDKMKSSSSTSDMCAKSSGGDSGGSGGDEHKMCTSYEQNIEHCKKDGADNTSGSSTKTDIKSSSDNVDDIADGIGMVDISDKDTDKDFTEEDDQNYLISVQNEITSIYSKKRNHFDNVYKAMGLSDPKNVEDPIFIRMKAVTFKMIDEDEIKNKKLFQDSPPKEDCPICILPMPFSGELDGRVRFSYQFCCGKRVCTGCIDAAKEEVRKGKMKDLCPFCRIPNPKSEKEDLKRCRKRMKLKDAYAFYELGDQYYNGRWGLPQHLSKACELWTQAAELGSIHAHAGLGDAYMRGCRRRTRC